MTVRPHLPLFFLLLSMSGLSFAQQDTAGEPQDAESVQSESDRVSAEEQTQDNQNAESPYDYEASEQISEDLPVSFPVDI